MSGRTGMSVASRPVAALRPCTVKDSSAAVAVLRGRNLNLGLNHSGHRNATKISTLTTGLEVVRTYPVSGAPVESRANVCWSMDRLELPTRCRHRRFSTLPTGSIVGGYARWRRCTSDAENCHRANAYNAQIDGRLLKEFCPGSRAGVSRLCAALDGNTQ